MTGNFDNFMTLNVEKIRKDFPIIERETANGKRVIYLDSIKEPYGFRSEDLSLLTALGNSAAIAVENALLYAGKNGLLLN